MSPFAAEALAEGVCALTRDLARGAVFCDIDGTLAPVMDRADDAQAPGAGSGLLGAVGRRYACVARVSGGRAAEARPLVGEPSVADVGLHGAELLKPGQSSPCLTVALGQWQGPVRRFAAARDTRELRMLRIRIEDKGPIVAFHRSGATSATGRPGRRERSRPRSTRRRCRASRA